MSRLLGRLREARCDDCRERFPLEALAAVEWTMPGHKSAYYILCYECIYPLREASLEMKAEGIDQDLYYRAF